MNDVRKWLADKFDNVEPGEPQWELVKELLDLIGRDAATDPWEAVADIMAERIRLLDSRHNGSSAGTLAAYRKMKEKSRGQGA